MLHTYDAKQVFSEKIIGFHDSFDVTKCLQQIEMPELLHMYKTMSFWDTVTGWRAFIGKR